MIIMIIIKRSCNYFTNGYPSCTYHAINVNIFVFLCAVFCMWSCVDIGKTCPHWLSNKMFAFEFQLMGHHMTITTKKQFIGLKNYKYLNNWTIFRCFGISVFWPFGVLVFGVSVFCVLAFSALVFQCFDQTPSPGGNSSGWRRLVSYDNTAVNHS